MINSLMHPAVPKLMLIFTYHFKCTIHMIHDINVQKAGYVRYKDKNHI